MDDYIYKITFINGQTLDLNLKQAQAVIDEMQKPENRQFVSAIATDGHYRYHINLHQIIYLEKRDSI